MSVHHPKDRWQRYWSIDNGSRRFDILEDKGYKVGDILQYNIEGRGVQDKMFIVTALMDSESDKKAIAKGYVVISLSRFNPSVC